MKNVSKNLKCEYFKKKMFFLISRVLSFSLKTKNQIVKIYWKELSIGSYTTFYKLLSYEVLYKVISYTLSIVTCFFIFDDYGIANKNSGNLVFTVFFSIVLIVYLALKKIFTYSLWYSAARISTFVLFYFMQLLFSIDKKCSSQHIVRCISYANHTNETLTGSLQMQQITYHCISSKKNYQYPLFIIKDNGYNHCGQCCQKFLGIPFS